MRWRQAAIVIITILQLIALLPTLFFFERFAFGDCGWPLTVSVMMHEHPDWVPAIDFAYFYGLLTLVIDRAAFAVFGPTPETVVGLFAVSALAIAVGAGRTMAALKLRCLPSLYLISTSALFTIPRGFPSPAHAFEAALLMNAVADHAAGRLGGALVLVLLAVFVKPSLGYVYGAILVVAILRRPYEGIARWRLLLPAAGVGLALVAGLSALYSFPAVIRTQMPFTAMDAYRDADFGFFLGIGRGFWSREEPSLQFFLNDVAGIWLVSSVLLVLLALRALPRYREPAAQITLTCAALHLVFVCVLFGNRWSWFYYPYFLFVGTAVALDGCRPRVRAVLCVLLIAFSIWKQDRWVWKDELTIWFTWVRTPETGNLASPPDEARLWGEVRELGRQNPDRVFVLTRMGCPHVLTPELGGPQWWCLIRSILTKEEKLRACERIRSADWIVSPNWHDNDLMAWPEFADDLKPFREEGSTPFFKMYHRQK